MWTFVIAFEQAASCCELNQHALHIHACTWLATHRPQLVPVLGQRPFRGLEWRDHALLSSQHCRPLVALAAGTPYTPHSSIPHLAHCLYCLLPRSFFELHQTEPWLLLASGADKSKNLGIAQCILFLSRAEEFLTEGPAAFTMYPPKKFCEPRHRTFLMVRWGRAAWSSLKETFNGEQKDTTLSYVVFHIEIKA